jgi:hypothetical protein
MKTRKELEKSILAITVSIQENYPELSKYIMEMPENNSEDEAVNFESLEDYHSSLQGILDRYAETHFKTKALAHLKTKEYADLQIYPASDDIYQKLKIEKDINPEDITKMKAPNEKVATWNEKDFTTIKTGADLDVPGAELDDQQENIGSEDEENNYYSLGGDNHNDLDENKE